MLLENTNTRKRQVQISSNACYITIAIDSECSLLAVVEIKKKLLKCTASNNLKLMQNIGILKN